MNELDNIIEKLKELKPYLEKEYKIKEVGIFGSYVRNEQTENSDIDILVEYAGALSLFKVANLVNYLELKFGKKVDLTNKKTLRPKIGKRILSEVKFV
ncbi:MAG: nucleotidyltransferase family protein [Ignavibacteriales bacterium]|nr:nucleotidyltransferase family protein [Ignavibacteriales bacterium]